MNTNQLSGQVAVITGSARGIGREIARTFARAGARVVISDLQLADCERTAQEIAAASANETAAIPWDVREASGALDLARATVERFGRLDVWVNNAGVRADDLLVRMKALAWDHVIDVNLKGAFSGTQAAAKVMLKARRGKIINIGSNAGTFGNAGQINYAASKAGLAAITKTAARELASRNITVNYIAAGFVRNDFASDLSPAALEWIENQVPLKNPRDPSIDIALAARFLASGDADWITGTILRVDGGLGIGF